MLKFNILYIYCVVALTLLARLHPCRVKGWVVIECIFIIIHALYLCRFLFFGGVGVGDNLGDMFRWVKPLDTQIVTIVTIGCYGYYVCYGYLSHSLTHLEIWRLK